MLCLKLSFIAPDPLSNVVKNARGRARMLEESARTSEL